MTRLIENRQHALAKLIEWYGQTPEDYDEGEEEDPRPYLSGESELQRFVCVTQHGEKTFFLPCFDSPVLAQERAVEYVNDDIWAESPVEVYDLDTGNSYRPDWKKLPWKQHNRSRAQ